MTLVRLAPEATTDVISDANLRTVIERGQIDLALKGRALPKNEKLNVVASQREYVVSGASALLTDNDFLAIDLRGGGVQFYDGSRWLADPEFSPKTREWLDAKYQGWRTNSATSVPLYWYLDTKEDTGSDLVVGLVDKPSANGTDYLWVHYLSRGKLPTDDTHYLWTGSTTQLVYLEPYEILAVYYCLDWINRLITKQTAEADKYRLMYEEGAARMASRLPLAEHLIREGFEAVGYFSHFR